MQKEISIGIVIADEGEYELLNKLQGIALKENFGSFYKENEFSLTNGEKKIVVNTVFSKNGKVNAAAAAMYLVCNKHAQILFNFGYSGGVFGVSRGETVIGVSFLEHDFDLTCLGYKMCEKPGQSYIYKADKRLINAAENTKDIIRLCNFASGDRFVSDKNFKKFLSDEFHINCCDMESAAIAAVADICNIPFCSIRTVSDNADETAKDDYRELNIKAEDNMAEITLKTIKNLFFDDSFWVKA